MKNIIGNLLLGLTRLEQSKIGKKTDGKKTKTGVLLTAAGVGMLFIPGFQAGAVSALSAGLPILFTGIAHKIIKKRRNQNG